MEPDPSLSREGWLCTYCRRVWAPAVRCCPDCHPDDEPGREICE